MQNRQPKIRTYRSFALILTTICECDGGVAVEVVPSVSGHYDFVAFRTRKMIPFARAKRKSAALRKKSACSRMRMIRNVVGETLSGGLFQPD